MTADKLVELAERLEALELELAGATGPARVMSARLKVRPLATDLRALAQSAASEWVAVSERLPEFGQRVLICAEGASFGRMFTDIADFQDGDDDDFDSELHRFTIGIYDEPALDLYKAITHWRELPSPPLAAGRDGVGGGEG